MYDRKWTRTIVDGFRRDRTRTINIDNCISQRTLEAYSHPATAAEIHNALIYSLQRNDRYKLWSRYKRLCTKSPLCDFELNMVVDGIQLAIIDERTERLQKAFPFETT